MTIFAGGLLFSSRSVALTTVRVGDAVLEN
jgi:hypothetical protein